MPSKPRRILGIDPGYGRMGWAVIEVNGQQNKLRASGCLVTKKSTPESVRLLELFDSLHGILEKQKPGLVAMERLYFQRNTSTAVGVGQARGVALLACAQHQLPVQEFSPSDVKLSVTGYGRADKHQIGRMICLLLKLKIRPRLDDETDAIAIALCAGVRRPVHAI